ncbi:MAG: DedA family protein [Patescibacteria group bacterium]
MAITESIIHIATTFIETAGYPGIGVLMIMESMILPVPSEAVMPFAGFLIFDGTLTWAGVIIVSTIGSILGSLLSYWIGAKGGRPLVERWGKYVLVSHHDLDITDRFFARRGSWAVLISRFIPVIRHIISIPAGVAKMPLKKFLVMTILGATLWNTFLTWVGFKLGENWENLHKYSEKIDIVIVAILILLVAAFVYRHWRTRDRGVATG